MSRRQPAPLPPPTRAERDAARDAAALLRRVVADPDMAGRARVVFVDYPRPRRGVQLVTWPAIPGLLCEVSAAGRSFEHQLLPGWTYTKGEMRTEMIEDLDRLAALGIRPEAASVPSPQLRLL